MQIDMDYVANRRYAGLSENDRQQTTINDVKQEIFGSVQQCRRHLNGDNAIQERHAIQGLSTLHSFAPVQLKSKLYFARGLMAPGDMETGFHVRFLEAVHGAAVSQLEKFESMWVKYYHVARRLDFFDTRLSNPDATYDVLGESENPETYVFVPPPRSRIFPDSVQEQWTQYCHERSAARDAVRAGNTTAESIYADPMEYWKQKEGEWSELSRIAQHWLQLQISSVFAERVFSVMRYHVNAHRSSLTPENVENEMILLTNPTIVDIVCDRHEAEWETVNAQEPAAQ